MMTAADIPEMLEALEAGELDLEEVDSLCLDLFEHHQVDAVIEQLPAPVRDELVARWRGMFDNETPARNFMLLSSSLRPLRHSRPLTSRAA